jgi:putative metallohydrolase (TIGR04338 family)
VTVSYQPGGAVSATQDPHRDAVYDAETRALPGGGRRFTRFAHLEAHVVDVTTGGWWAATFPDAPVEVDVLRRSRTATFSAAHVTADATAGVVWVRDGSWDLVTVVHELAHVAAGPAADTSGPHGCRFATALLVCWRELLGFDAYGALRSALDRNGVPYQRDRLG